MEGESRVHPPQVNYDNILPLAVESRSNRREFLPVNGQSFSNTTGATICRIDVNADSMLDATHSYLECDITNSAGANTFLALEQFTPAWIQRLRIESGGVVIEDINEYSRLFSMLSLCQCPKEYIKNNYSNLGLYKEQLSCALTGVQPATAHDMASNGGSTARAGGAETKSTIPTTELVYNMSAECVLNGVEGDQGSGVPTVANLTNPSASGLANVHTLSRLSNGATRKMCIPLVSGFLNMDKYIPLIMMNAGFTIELTLCDANRIGLTQTEIAGQVQGAQVDSVWSVSNVRYIAHLIDMDRSFYDRLRMVMDGAGGVLQLAGQTYRHYSGLMDLAGSQYTISLPARVKSVKSIFGTFIQSAQVGVNTNYDTSVFQRANITSFRFEIGSVRYPQTDVSCNGKDQQAQREAELDKAFGKIGDYQHQKAYSHKHTINNEDARDGETWGKSTLSAFFVGYDFEAFNRVLLEQGIDTSSRSLPINFIATKGATAGQVRADFYVLCDAIFYINLDGTASVSV
jgi:hypothetical protein